MPYQSTLAAHSFKNHTVVVTGGGSGIGRCTAHEIAALGGHVILIGRRENKLIDTANEIKQDGGKASFYSLDIRDEVAVTTAIETLLKQSAPRPLAAGGDAPYGCDRRLRSHEWRLTGNRPRSRRR